MSSASVRENQLYPELLSVCSFNPWAQHDSSGREQMLSSHLGQMLVLNGSTERKCQTGTEREYAKYTFNIKMPVDGEIIEIIERYRPTLGEDSIVNNPQIVVIYEDVVTKEIGMISLPKYCSNHQYFGFQYQGRSGLQHLRVGAFIPKDTVFLDSPSVTEEGGYKYGVELNMILATLPSTSEDGVLICRDALPKLGFKTYENRVVEWGSKKFALNLYGDKNNYKPFPDIGDKIREDGLLMALRSYEPSLLAPVEQSVEATMDVDFTFDHTYYANGPGGTIIDIRIHHDINNSNHADVHMDKQAQKYDSARRHYYGRIVEMWKKFHKKRGDALQITPELQRLVVEAFSVVSEGSSQRVSKLYRQTPLDDYRVEFVIEYNIEPAVGFKITGCHGDKGIICQIAEPHEMPVDSEGNRADIVMDPNSTIARMNLGRLYEIYINASSRDTHKRLCKLLNVNVNQKHSAAIKHIKSLDSQTTENAYQFLLGYYKIVSPKMYNWFVDGSIKETKEEYLASIISRGVTLYIPTDNEPESPAIIKALELSPYKPVYGPVSYIGNSGKRVVTKENIRIGSMYFILLEKTGDDWAAVSSVKLQHFGVLAQLTKSDKYSKPARKNAVRAAGEAEVRIFASNMGGKSVAEMMDRNNNPKTHKHIVKGILSADKPTDIDNLVDRDVLPFGGSKPLSLVKHLAMCGGWKFAYKPYKPYWG